MIHHHNTPGPCISTSCERLYLKFQFQPDGTVNFQLFHAPDQHSAGSQILQHFSDPSGSSRTPVLQTCDYIMASSSEVAIAATGMAGQDYWSLAVTRWKEDGIELDWACRPGRGTSPKAIIQEICGWDGALNECFHGSHGHNRRFALPSRPQVTIAWDDPFIRIELDANKKHLRIAKESRLDPLAVVPRWTYRFVFDGIMTA